MLNEINLLKEEVEKIKQQRNRQDKFNLFLGLSGLTMLLAAFFLTLFNIIDFQIIAYIFLPIQIEVIINLSLFALNMLFMQMFVSNNKLVIKTAITFLPCLIASAFIPLKFALIATFLMPVLICFCLNYQNKKYLLVFWCFVLPFQYLFKYIKMNVFAIEYTHQNAITSVILSIDIIVFYIYLVKVVKKYVELVGLDTKFNWVIPKRKYLRQNSKENSTLTAKQELIKNIFMIVYFSFQIAVLILLAQLNNLLVEMILLLVMFLIGRSLLGASWHANSLKVCFTVSTVSFYALAKITLPLSISLFTIIVSCGAFIYMMHRLGLKDEKIENLEQLVTPEMVMRKQCELVGMSKLLTEVCIDWKIHGMSRKEQANKHNYTVATIRKYRNTIHKKYKIK